MALPRRLWCSCTIIDFLKGEERARPCIDIIRQCERRQLEIVVSALAMAEVAKLDSPAEEAERRIKEFFSRDYLIAIPVDQRVAEMARSLVQQHSGLHGPDAVHVATALVYGVPVVETFDDRLLRLDIAESVAGLTVRLPLYDGGEQRTLTGL
jgi:predicted nucleic acid-binding protein